MKTDESRYRLVDAIYAVTLDPNKYGELIESWGNELAPAVEGTTDIELLKNGVPPLQQFSDQQLEEVRQHFARAHKIFDKFGRENSTSQDIKETVADDPLPSVLVSNNGNIAFANNAAETLLGTGSDTHVEDLPLQAGGDQRIMHHIRAAADVGRHVDAGSQSTSHIALVPAVAQRSDKVLLLGVAPVAREHSATDTNSPVARIFTVEMRWSKTLESWVKNIFDLSNSEAQVLSGIMEGDTLDAIATKRGRSLGTIRTQLKSILGKTGAGSQLNLVRMLAGFKELRDPEDGSRSFGSAFRHRTNFFTLSDGRRFEYSSYGPADGKPIVFVHSMMDGFAIAPQIEGEFEKRGLRFIAPWRACFAGSDPIRDRENAPRQFAEDLAELLSHLGIKKAAIVGHLGGATYAFAAAAFQPKRISAVINISGGVPIRTVKQFKQMAPRQRVIAYTARFTPNFLPFILRAGISQIDQGGVKPFMEALVEKSPYDRAVVANDDIFPNMAEGYRRSISQGGTGFEFDSYHVTRDWSDISDLAKQPAMLIHTEGDTVVTLESVREFAAERENRELHEFSDAGQFIFYQEPKRILDLIDNFLRRAT